MSSEERKEIFYDETLQESKGYLRPRLCERDGQDTCVYREQPESYVHWYRRVCEWLDSAGILHERDKPDPGQWSGTSRLQQRRIISDSQRHLSRQGLWRNLQLFIFSSRIRPKGGAEYYKGENQNGVSGLPACIDIYRAGLSVRCFGRVEVCTRQERGRELDDRPRRRERSALYFSRPDDIRRISGKLRICGAESETAGDARKTVRLMEETPNLLIKEKIKMENKTLLNETLESGMESLKTMKPGSEEYVAAVNSLAKLHEMQMNETAEENSKTAKEDEMQLKWHQVEADVQKADSDRRIEILKTVGGIAGTLIMGGLFVWNQVNGWFNEEEGHIPLSPTFKDGSRTLMQNIFRK